MSFEETLNQAETLLAPFAVGATRHEDHRVDVVVKRETLLAAVKALVDARWGYLITITGLDLPWPKPGAAKPAPAPPKPSNEGTMAKASEAPPKPSSEATLAKGETAPKPSSEGTMAKAGEASPKPPSDATMAKAGPMQDELEALYHFTEGPVVATLRVMVPYADPRVPSICPLVPTATLYERELQEMFGFVVEGTPVTDRLVLPDDWPEGVYPLRKSFTGLNKA